MFRTKEEILTHLEKMHRYYLGETPRPDEPATAYKILHDCASLIPFPELGEDEFLDSRIVSQSNQESYWKTRDDYYYMLEGIYNEPYEASRTVLSKQKRWTPRCCMSVASFIYKKISFHTRRSLCLNTQAPPTSFKFFLVKFIYKKLIQQKI